MARAETSSNPSDKRQFPRKSLPLGYSEVSIRRPGHNKFDMVGHAYDISAGGIRFELDYPIDCGEEVEVKVALPGEFYRQVDARGVMVRYHDPEEVGPVRMALTFTGMDNPEDRIAIDCYVRGDQLTPAVA